LPQVVATEETTEDLEDTEEKEGTEDTDEALEELRGRELEECVAAHEEGELLGRQLPRGSMMWLGQVQMFVPRTKPEPVLQQLPYPLPSVKHCSVGSQQAWWPSIPQTVEFCGQHFPNLVHKLLSTWYRWI
jgi:hypothetical protein